MRKAAGGAVVGEELAGRYRVLREIGRGGMGVVYQAHDPLLDRDVAVKLLDPEAMSPSAAQRFEREARVIARMDHPSIMNVFDIGRHGRSMFFVMPLARGSSLRDVLDRGTLDAPSVVKMAIEVAAALQYSHRSGIVHRDIKPENIMLTGTGEDLRAALTDFGLAVSESAEDRLTRSDTIVGTPAYLAPEQIHGGAAAFSPPNFDGRTDLYSLGVVMYEALTGAIPFPGSLDETLRQIVHRSPDPPHLRNESVHRELSRIVLWCMEKEPARRPQDAAQLEAALQRFQLRRGRTAPKTSLRLIGRRREIDVVERLLERAREGEAHLVLIAGEAGIGKTRFIEQIELMCGIRGVRFLDARFVGHDEDFQAFSDLLQTWCQSASTEQVRDAFSECAAELVAVFPILREIDGLRDAAPASVDRKETSEMLATAFGRISRGQPLVLALEDLHSAGASIEALEFLLRRLAPAPLLIIGTYRPQDLARRHPLHALIEEAKRDQRAHLLALRPLDSGEQCELLEQVLGEGTVSPAANQRIFAVTEGNPFFLQELTRALRKSNTLVLEGSVWNLSDEAELDAAALPPTIQQAVERRIESLDPPARAVLETAAVIGRSFDIAEVEHLMESSGVDEPIERLADEGFLREERGRGERFTFSSALMREVAYARVARRRRRALHGRYAALLEERSPGRTAELLHHYAEADEAERVVAYGLQVARSLLELYRAGETLRATRLVIDFLDADGQGRAHEIEARMLAARAHRLDGNVDAALRELDLAARLGDGEHALAAAADAAETAWEARRIEDAARWVERGLGTGGSSAQPTRRLLSIAATLANLRGETESARALFDRADALEAHASRVVAGSGRGGVIRVPIAGDLFSLDPALAFTLVHIETLSVVYETLTRETGGARVAPWLASAIDADAGGRRFRIELRDDVRFHDGRRVSADDVRHSFERLLRGTTAEARWMLAPIAGAREYGEGSADRIEGLHVESDRRLMLELQEPVSFFPAVLAHLPAAVVPERAACFTGNWSEGCVGTGPFRVVDFSVGRELRLEASPFYWRAGLPRADGIVFRFGVPPAEIARGLREGTFDVGWDLRPADLEELRRDPRFARGLRETPRLSTYYIAFNVNHGPLRDESLRREIAETLDIAKLVASLGRVAVPARGFIPPGLLGCEPSRRRVARAPASHFSRVPLRAMLNSAYQGTYAGFTELLFDAFSAIGLEISVIEGRSEYAANQAEALAPAEILFTRWIADYPDAHDFAALLHSRTGVVGHVCGTPAVDRLIERGASESNPDVRHQLYRQIEDILVERALLLPLFHEQSYRLARPEVQDFAVNYFSPVIAWDTIWIE